ncbi:sigma 54-interacting transcriptional regulator [bacterium]|jgi:transcriptional regulator of acetoin/glycerol metabolism|nr:sigma 54-interacting transcriptional regulator [bacterium]
MTNNILNSIISFLGSYSFLLFVNIVAFVVKTFVLAYLINYNSKLKQRNLPLLFLCLVVFFAIIADIGWGYDCVRLLYLPGLDMRIRVLVVRFSWMAFLAHYLFLSLFIESLTEKKYRVKIWHKVSIPICAIAIGVLLYLAIFKFNAPLDRPKYEFKIFLYIFFYIYVLLAPSIYTAWRKIQDEKFPNLIRNQIKVFIYNITIPLLVAEFIQVDPFSFSSNFTFNATSIAIVSINFIIRTYAIYYSSKKIIGLRFLNIQKHVQSLAPDRSNFIDYFKDILEQLGYLTTPQELKHVTQIFFKDVLGVPFSYTRLHLRSSENRQKNMAQREFEVSRIESTVEEFINTESGTTKIIENIQKTKILIKDEIEFNNHIYEDETNRLLLEFLEAINSELFIPIFKKERLIGYITIESDSRRSRLYSNLERDKMVVFAGYLGNVINLLQNKNIYSLIKKDKELKEELYNKHQEINQYKESIRSFMHNNKENDIGIILYKNRRFSYSNQSAEKLIDINLNTQEGHPLTKDIKELAQQVEGYRSSQKIQTLDTHGNKIVLHAAHSSENNCVIILVHRPGLSSVLQKQIGSLKDPSNWDYLLYLETTESGKLINQLIPGKTEKILSFKIDLLKIALSKKALLLDLPEEDLTATIEIIHHISLRENLHILSLQQQYEGENNTAIKLFGINAIFGKAATQPILEKLNKTGTLFIKNIHLMDLETQRYLANFLRYGFYKIFKSDIKVWSDVRVICSSNQSLRTLVQEGRFSDDLYNELSKTSLVMPSMLALSEEELSDLAEGFTQQAIKTQDFKNFLKLSDTDKNKLSLSKPVSLHELKNRVLSLLVNKSKKHAVYDKTEFDPAYHTTDPGLVEASRLGKHALRDPKIMIMLWNKFKSQSQIADFLGVNRSSVNRRCKEYDLI